MQWENVGEDAQVTSETLSHFFRFSDSFRPISTQFFSCFRLTSILSRLISSGMHAARTTKARPSTCSSQTSSSTPEHQPQSQTPSHAQRQPTRRARVAGGVAQGRRGRRRRRVQARVLPVAAARVRRRNGCQKAFSARCLGRRKQSCSSFV